MLEKQGEKQWGLGGDGHSLLEPSEVYPETGLCPDQLAVWFICVLWEGEGGECGVGGEKNPMGAISECTSHGGGHKG